MKAREAFQHQLHVSVIYNSTDLDITQGDRVNDNLAVLLRFITKTNG
jgi:hypothetical protein